MKQNRKIVVIGGSHHNTLGVIRSLGRKGVRPLVILTSGGEHSFVLKSKYIDKFWCVKGSDAAVKLLLKDFVCFPEKPILVACHDIISSCLDLNRNILEHNFILPGTRAQGQLTELMDKQRMCALAKECGMNVPETIVVSDESCKSFDNISYPCIIKPLESRKGSKSEIQIFHDRKHLELFVKHNSQGRYLVQTFIEKQVEFQLIGCSLEYGNKVIIPGISQIIRQPENTNTGFLHYTQATDSFKESIEFARKFVKLTGYEGLFSVEMLRDKKGADFFMEMNFRNDGNSIAVTNAGCNLPYIWYLYCSGHQYDEELCPIHDEYVMPEFAELSLYEQGKLSMKQLKEDMLLATSYMDYAEDDPDPTSGWKNYNRRKNLSFARRIAYKILKRV